MARHFSWRPTEFYIFHMHANTTMPDGHAFLAQQEPTLKFSYFYDILATNYSDNQDYISNRSIGREFLRIKLEKRNFELIFFYNLNIKFSETNNRS